MCGKHVSLRSSGSQPSANPSVWTFVERQEPFNHVACRFRNIIGSASCCLCGFGSGSCGGCPSLFSSHISLTISHFCAHSIQLQNNQFLPATYLTYHLSMASSINGNTPSNTATQEHNGAPKTEPMFGKPWSEIDVSLQP